MTTEDQIIINLLSKDFFTEETLLNQLQNKFPNLQKQFFETKIQKLIKNGKIKVVQYLKKGRPVKMYYSVENIKIKL